MKLGEVLLKQLNKKYERDTMISLKIKGYDIRAKTDENGNAIQAFVGKAKENGTIKGDRYARTLKYDREGHLIKDHWERKGYAT
ncbi:MAG: hypothetical protein JWP69_2448 [Flaviaesturariibacter sp.]|nr:hypothetical protein [Flaviaesturariibacter sp.]